MTLRRAWFKAGGKGLRFPNGIPRQETPVSDNLRDRIAAVIYRHTLFRALDECECGASFDGFCGRALDAYAAHVADAVIAELGLRRDEVGLLHRHVTEWFSDD